MTNGRVCLSLSAVSLWILASPNSDGQTFFIRLYRTEYRRLFRAQYVESSIWSSFSSSRPMVFSPPISWKSPWPRSHSFVTLLLIYYVTRKRCLPLHDVALGTTAQGVPYVSAAPLPPPHRCVWRVATTLRFSCWCIFLSCMSVSICGFGKKGHHLSQERHSMFLRPGYDLRSSSYTKRQRR